MTSSAENNVVCIGNELTEDQQKLGFRCMVVSSMISMMGNAVFVGEILTLIALNLGGEEGYIGFMRFVIFMAAVSQVLMARLALRVSKKKVLLTIFMINGIICIPILFIQQMHSAWGQTVSLVVLLCIVSARSIVMSMSTPSWMGFLREMLPEAQRGRLLGILRTSWQSTLMLILIGVGLYLGKKPSWHQLQLVLIATVIAQFLRALVLIPAPKVPIRLTKEAFSWWQTIKMPLQDQHYRTFLVYTLFFYFAMGMSEGFRVVYLWRLGFGQNMVLISASLMALGAVSTLMFWGKLADRFGNRNVFSLTIVGVMLATLLWLIVDSSNFGLILAMVLFFASGAFRAGNGLVHTRYMFANLKSEMDASYISMTFIAIQIAVGSGSLIGGQILLLFSNVGFVTGESFVNNYHILFFISSVVFIVPWWLRSKLREPTEVTTFEVITLVLGPIRQFAGSMLLRPRNSKK